MVNSYQLMIEQQARDAGADAVFSTNELQPRASLTTPPATLSMFNGDKFFGGFGTTQIYTPDYWTLRQRSDQLFRDNLYARGLIRRLITNEINTGLTPEALPNEEIIGLPEDSLDTWTDTVEDRFDIWGKNPNVCDRQRQNTFGALQRIARREALVTGDILVVLLRSQQTGLPQIKLVSGADVRSPLGGSDTLRKGHEIKHGVELDANGRHVAFWITQKDGSSKRLPAFGEKSGRKLAWLVYGTDKRMDDVRGEPILALVLQSLREVDRYRDSVQRKALISSLYAMQVIKTEDKPGTLPLQGGAVRKDQVTTTDGEGANRQYNIASYLPGMVIDEMQTGEEIKMIGSEGTDINFGTFEEAIIQAVAWANEIPPEILRMSFSNNYSASQAAINEFKIYLNLTWTQFGEAFCAPIFVDWLISETLQGKIQAPGLLQAWRDPRQYDVFGAWISTEWYGSIKPSTDMLKQVKASDMMVAGGYSTRTREARIMTGTNYRKNVKRLVRENEMLVAAQSPLREAEAEASTPEAPPAPVASALEDQIEAAIDDYLQDGEFASGG